MGAVLEFKPKNADIDTSGDRDAGLCNASASSVPTPPSQYVAVPIPGRGGLAVTERGSRQHFQAFRFLRDKGMLERWVGMRPGFLPLKVAE